MDYYELLEIPRDIEQKKIRRAYLEAIKKTHPDANVGLSDEAVDDLQKKAVIINRAYETLKDPTKRAEYDRFLKNIKVIKPNRQLQFKKIYGEAYITPKGEIEVNSKKLPVYFLEVEDRENGRRQQQCQVVGNFNAFGREAEDCISECLTEKYLEETCIQHGGYLGDIMIEFGEVKIIRDPQIERSIKAQNLAMDKAKINSGTAGETIELLALSRKLINRTSAECYRYIYRDAKDNVIMDRIVYGEMDFDLLKHDERYQKMAAQGILNPNEVEEQLIFQGGYIGELTASPSGNYIRSMEPDLVQEHSKNATQRLYMGNGQYIRIKELGLATKLENIDSGIKRYKVWHSERPGFACSYDIYGKLDLKDIEKRKEMRQFFSNKNLQRTILKYYGNFGKLEEEQTDKKQSNFRALLRTPKEQFTQRRNSLITASLRKSREEMIDGNKSLAKIGEAVIAGRQLGLYSFCIDPEAIPTRIIANIEKGGNIIPQLEAEAFIAELYNGYVGTIGESGIEKDYNLANIMYKREEEIPQNDR